MKSRSILITAAAIALAVPAFAQQKTGMRMLKTFPIGSAGGWDYLTADSQNGKLYISHGTQVNSETTNEVVVIDVKTYKVIKRFKIVAGEEPTGLAIDRTTGRLFIGCGGNQLLVVMDTATGKNIASFPIGSCDGVAFERS
ncbi:YncE family protein [Hufsiella ginkgonis]|uniref:YncE family protein n=1 Tax=Hufsiella ginkgonis TaxID=2695274 RepID=A0A7K1XT54_9SPHI|nr:hypothetical protein [Hufsiella ginkgonis]MXV14028.1 hypothetical protein [Hufsiella ginkgonis]